MNLKHHYMTISGAQANHPRSCKWGVKISNPLTILQHESGKSMFAMKSEREAHSADPQKSTILPSSNEVWTSRPPFGGLQMKVGLFSVSYL
jgi:hypothetical protein